MPSAKVTLDGTMLAESKETVVVEGNHYFSPGAIDKTHFKPSDTHTFCGWKRTASYYNVEVKGKTMPDAAWYYLDCMEGAKHLENWVAFYKNKVTIEDL